MNYWYSVTAHAGRYLSGLICLMLVFLILSVGNTASAQERIPINGQKTDQPASGAEGKDSENETGKTQKEYTLNDVKVTNVHNPQYENYKITKQCLDELSELLKPDSPKISSDQPKPRPATVFSPDEIGRLRKLTGQSFARQEQLIVALKNTIGADPTVKLGSVIIEHAENEKTSKAGLNDRIVVKVENLEILLNQADCKTPFADTNCHKQSVSLFLNGREVKGLEPEAYGLYLDDQSLSNGKTFHDGWLQYHLIREAILPEDNKDNEEHWADLLGMSSDWNDWSWERPVDVSVGLSGDYALKTAATAGQFSLIRVRPYRLISWMIGVLVGVGCLIWLVLRKNLLCDHAPTVWPQPPPYSLGFVQAAWWFLLIVVSFIFIWLVTNDYNFSTTALILLGISVGTALGAFTINGSKRGTNGDERANPDELNHLLADKMEIEKKLNRMVKQKGLEPTELNALKAVYDAKIAEIRSKFPKALGPGREGFLLDILMDTDGISFHRFQMLVWTLVLGVFFITAVIGNLAMPEFSGTLLTLMGISAGTYIGFKLPEKPGVPSLPGVGGDKNAQVEGSEANNGSNV